MSKKKKAEDSFVVLTSDRYLLVLLCSSPLIESEDSFCSLCTAACFECELEMSVVL